MQYLIDNKEWIFSGIGATILGLIITFLIMKQSKNQKKANIIKDNDIKLNNSSGNSIQLIRKQVNHDKPKIDLLSQDTLKSYRELYRLIDLAIKSVEIGFAPIKVNPSKGNDEFLNDSIVAYNQFSEYFDSNEILFDLKTISLTKNIRDLIFRCIKQQKLIENYKTMNMPTEKLFPEIDKFLQMYDLHISNELPQIKEKLKNHIKTQMKQ